MMKKILTLILSIIIFSCNVYATNVVSSINATYEIDENGSAEVSETWVIKSGDTFIKNLELPDGITVKNLKIASTNNSYSKRSKCELNKNYTYCINKNDYIKFKIGGTKDEIILNYTIDNFIVKYKDVLGLDLLIYSNKDEYEIKKYNVTITGSYKFSESNTGIYAIGNNIEISFKNSNLLLKIKNIKNENIRLLTSFNNDTNYQNFYTNNYKYQSYYELVTKKESTSHKILKKLIVVVIITLLIVGLIFIITFKIQDKIKMKGKNRAYKNIEIIDDVVLQRINEVPYYETIPCHGSLFKINFIGGCFDIIKNPTNIVGAYMFKWILEGRITLVDEGLKFNTKRVINNTLEQELYDLLSTAATSKILDQNKINTYVRENREKFKNWFEKINKVVLDNEVSKGTIKKNKKKYIINEKEIEEAKTILGVKRYLLHFNQVPRSTELTENTYKSLLVCAVLFGISEDVGKEILRKSSDNIFATNMLEFNKIKMIYKSIYNLAYEEK